MSKRLEILKNSLSKKQKRFDDAFENHFDDVKSANGQPLNDKRNGTATLNRWERQNNSLRRLKQEIEKTEQAIDREESKQAWVNIITDELPACIIDRLHNGSLIQWKKHPHIFFVPGVDKARIVYDTDKKIISYNYLSSITCKEQYNKFADAFNTLKKEINSNN
jgi:hypothetical protein